MSEVWPSVPLGEVLTQSDESTKLEPEKEYQQVTVRMWGQGVTERDRVKGREIKAEKRYVVRPGQFIMSRIDARNGAFGLVPETLDGGVVSNDFPSFEFSRERMLPEFLAWLSKTRSFIEICTKASEGSTNRVRLKVDKFLKMPIDLPPISEQQRIVGRLKHIASKIEEARGLRSTSREETEVLLTATLKTMMEDNADDWRQCDVASVIESMDAGWSPRCLDYPASQNEWGVLKTTSVQWCEFRPKENKALPEALLPKPEYAVQEGDVLVTRAGPLKRVGVAAAVRESNPNLMLSDKLIRLRLDLAKILPRFLELALSAPLAQEHLVQRKTGLAEAQVNISQKILSRTPLAVPRIAEQKEIVEHFDRAKDKINSLKQLQAQTRGELDALLPSVLDKAFRGEL